MGKGDKRTKRGKTNNGSFGKTRPHRAPKKAAVAPAALAAAAPHPARGRAH
ncbi:MAG: 30S ribosomal protein THX [Burkholderiaceae bacterium]